MFDLCIEIISDFFLNLWRPYTVPEKDGYIVKAIKSVGVSENLRFLTKHLARQESNTQALTNYLHVRTLISNTFLFEMEGPSHLKLPLNFTNDCLSFNWLQESKCNDDPFVRLQKLTIHLKELLSLHRNYNCRLSLAEYCDETTESLTYRMLDHVVAVELIPSTIEKVVRPYMQEHGLDEDKMMFQYIDVCSKPCILLLW